MNPYVLADCVKDYVAAWALPLSDVHWRQVVSSPAQAFDEQAAAFEAVLQAKGLSVGSLSAYMRTAPYLHVPSAFPIRPLPDTPTNWVHIPDGPMTRGALAASLLVIGACGMEAVAYGSENAGALFVNLVPLPGKGVLAEKSQGGMRGHTDAATFPFRGTLDPDHPRIAPSPDLLVLAALRNPGKVATTVRPLDQVLEQLSQADIEVLKGPNFVISAQKSFVQGTTQILGERHVLDGAAFLRDTTEGTWVRYTHGESLVFDQNNSAARQAKERFEAACKQTEVSVALAAGDLLLVNNRRALHGRSAVGPTAGGQARWLIRAYGLDCSQLSEEQRYDGSFKLYP